MNIENALLGFNPKRGKKPMCIALVYHEVNTLAVFFIKPHRSRNNRKHISVSDVCYPVNVLALRLSSYLGAKWYILYFPLSARLSISCVCTSAPPAFGDLISRQDNASIVIFFMNKPPFAVFMCTQTAAHFPVKIESK